MDFTKENKLFSEKVETMKEDLNPNNVIESKAFLRIYSLC